MLNLAASNQKKKKFNVHEIFFPECRSPKFLGIYYTQVIKVKLFSVDIVFQKFCFPFIYNLKRKIIFYF